MITTIRQIMKVMLQSV